MNRPKSAQNYNPSQKVLVVGASGYLGHAICVGLREEYEVYGTYLRHQMKIEGVPCFPLNAEEPGEVYNLIQKAKFDTVIYAAGSTNLEDCELDPKTADLLNFQCLSYFFKNFSIPPRFVYFSTDYVFSGTDRKDDSFYIEKDKTDPTTAYGLSKAKGESVVLPFMLGNIVRLPLVYGERYGHPRSPKNQIGELLFQAIEKKTDLVGFSDLVRSTVYVGDVIRGLRKLLKKTTLHSEIFHFSAGDSVSHFDFVEAFVEKFSEDSVKVQSGEYQAIKKKGSLDLPPNVALASKSTQEELEFEFSNLEKGLAEMADRFETGHMSDWL